MVTIIWLRTKGPPKLLQGVIHADHRGTGTSLLFQLKYMCAGPEQWCLFKNYSYILPHPLEAVLFLERLYYCLQSWNLIIRIIKGKRWCLRSTGGSLLIRPLNWQARTTRAVRDSRSGWRPCKSQSHVRGRGGASIMVLLGEKLLFSCCFFKKKVQQMSVDGKRLEFFPPTHTFYPPPPFTLTTLLQQLTCHGSVHSHTSEEEILHSDASGGASRVVGDAAQHLMESTWSVNAAETEFWWRRRNHAWH